MLELVFSNRAEALIGALAERVAARQAGGGFWTPVPIVVPNPLVKRFVREGLAARHGAAVNLDFRFLESLVGASLGESRRLWTPEAVAGRLLVRFGSGGLEPEVAAYLAGEGRGRKALQLAQRLASRFLDYALHRPDWVRLWRQGREAGGAGWQGRLFRAVDAELGGAGFVCPSDLAAEAPRLRWPEGALFVSLNTLAPAYLDLARRLGDQTDLAFFVLNPSEEFWADHPARKAFLEGGEAPEGHPALGLWGRPGRDFVARLYDLAEGQDETHYEPPGRGTLLRALQDDILAMRPPHLVSATTGGADRSLRILAAPGPRREAEVVATEVWRLLEDPPGGVPIRFSDIAMVVPAAESGAYLDHLRAAFEGAGRLPLAFESGTRGPLALLAEACGLLLDLLGTDASRAGVLRFLRHPASAARHPDLDPEAALALCEQAGILRGLDGSDFEGTYLAGLDRIHWEQGLSRAALGAFLPDGRTVPERDLPALTADRDAARTLDALVEDLRAWRKLGPREPSAWAEAFLALVERHLGDGEEAWVRARWDAKERLKVLAGYATDGLAPPRVAFPEARDLLRAQLERLDERPESGAGIRVSTAMPMRAVPFRAVFVMGLAEGLFPAADRMDPLDLRQREGNGRGSDLGRAEQDRYLFLELLLSARDALRLSYPSADPVTGDERPRSSVLEELLEILQAMGGDAGALVETHPLRRFDPVYFTPGSALRSLAPGAAAEALALATGAAPALPPLPGAALPPETLRLTLDQLHAWLMEPAEGLAKIRLGLRGEPEDGAALDQEPRAVGALDASPLEREALAAALGGGDAAAALDAGWRALELEGRVPLGPLGQAAKRQILERIGIWRLKLPGGGHRLHRFEAGEGGAEGVHGAVVFEAVVEGRTVKVSLVGRTRFVHADHLAETIRAEKPGADRRLLAEARLLVDQAALAAAGLPAPGLFLTVDGSGKVMERQVPAPAPEAARARLVGWVEAMLRAGPIRRLPAAYALARGAAEPADWIGRQDRRHEPWSALPGSVLRGLPAPGREAALEDLAFRLGPLMGPEDAP